MSRTKWYTKPIYVLVALALVLNLSLVMAVPVGADTDGTELVGSFSKTYQTTTTSTDFYLAIGLAAAIYVPEHEVWPGGPVVPARWDIDWSIARAPTYDLFQGMTPGAFLFEDIQFHDSDKERTFTISSVSDDPDFNDFAAFLTNGTNDNIWEAWIWPMHPTNNAGGIRCAGGLSGFLFESDVFSGIDIGTDHPGWVIQSVSLTFDDIYTVHSGDFDYLTIDYTVDIYAGPLTEVWVDDDYTSSTPGWGIDHFTTIQDGIDAVAEGGTVHVAAGEYEPASTIVIDKNGLTLLGPQANVDPRPSYGSTRTPGSATEAIIDGDDHGLVNIILIKADNVVINGLEVKSGKGDMIFQGDVHSGTTVKYCIIHDGCGDEGAQLKKCTNGILEYNYVYDIASPGDALNISDNSSNGKIRYNEVRDIGSENAAIYVYGSTDMEIVGNLVYDVSQNDAIKLGAKGGGDASKTGGVIKDNVIYDVAQDGITVYMSGVTVEGNEIYDSSSENGAIYLAYGITDIVIQNNSVHDNGLSTSKRLTAAGILLESRVDAATVTINFNNIYKNTPYGVTNEATVLLDAENNWWGDISGPSGVGFGTGDAVSDNVDYSPWLDAAYPDGKSIYFVDAKQDTITDGMLNAKAEADTEVVVDGSTTVTAAKYSDNPGVGFSGDIDKYIDVHIDDTTNVTELEIRLYYTDAEIAALDLDELSLRLHWWDGTAWSICLDSGVNPDENYMWAKVRATDTIPRLSDLVGAPFGASGEPVAEPAAELLEYGDAPDPTYPSLLLSDGARHSPTPTEILGLASTPDSKDFETDANVPNLDLLDDGLVTTTITAGNSAETVTFEVTDFMAPSYDLRVNILIDLNGDGDWADAGEHVVVNQPITTTATGIEEQVVVSTPFSTVGATPGSTWLRITLTRHDILNPPWDGTMTGYAPMTPFEYGETEDWEIIIEKAAPPPPPPPPPTGVGGTAYPPNKLAILTPWMALAAAIIAGTTILIRRRRAES